MADNNDLLRISDNLDEINGEVVGDTPDYGMNYTYLYIGMSGQKMVDKMNENFHATDAEFLAIAQALLSRIISAQIKEIKVEDNVVYYTTDGETWKSLQASWGNIAGNLADQTDLSIALADKIGTEQFNQLASNVNTNTANIILLDTSLNNLADSLSSIDRQINSSTGILVRLGNAETVLSNKISSQQVLEIRTTSGSTLEFTTDGVTWIPVSTAGVVEWGQIEGNIQEQADLRLLVSQINEAISNLGSTINNHADNIGNPHNVTKSQVGLGNVDNTSDMDKPVSNAQRAAIDAAANGQFKSLTHTEYEALTTKESNTFYFINDLEN